MLLLKVKPVTVVPVLKLFMLIVPPVLLTKESVPAEYVPPVIVISVAPVYRPEIVDVPPVLFLNVIVPAEYVPPVT